MGWPYRMPQKADEDIHDWMDKYCRVLYPHQSKSSTPQEFVEWLQEPNGTHPSQLAYQESFEHEDYKDKPLIMVGKTKVFMKGDITIRFDQAVNKALEKSANVVQAQYLATVHCCLALW